jgi:peptidoglycan-associated lipoprotein
MGAVMKRLRPKGITLVFLCLIILVVTSCTKKSVKMEEVVEPTTTSPEQVKPEEPGGAEKGVAIPETEAARKARAERQAQLRDQEQEERLLKEVRLFESEPIYFDFDEWDLTPDARAILTKKAAWLRTNLQFSVRIEGYCDERGTGEYNLALGERRADSAKKFLFALGISGKRLSTISFGEERPADPRHTEEAWAKNRRDEFKLIK